MARTLSLEPLHFDVLRALNTYRLLTYEMMKRIGVARSQKALGVAAEYLDRVGLIDVHKAQLIGRTPLPNIFWLTPKGAAVLHDYDPATNAKGSNRTFGDKHEVDHRLGLVRLHIAAQEWATAAGVRLVSWVGDYDRGAKGLGKATRIEGPGFRFVPDALAWVQLPGEDDLRLLVIEFERGGHKGDLSVFFSSKESKGKLSFLKTVSEGCYIENAYAAKDSENAYPAEDPPEKIKQPRFLIVFGSHVQNAAKEKVELHRKALAKWPDPEADVWDWFFVKDEDEAAAGFGDGWHQPGDRPQRSLFAKLAPPGPVPT
jgi:hypothetical protein